MPFTFNVDEALKKSEADIAAALAEQDALRQSFLPNAKSRKSKGVPPVAEPAFLRDTDAFLRTIRHMMKFSEGTTLEEYRVALEAALKQPPGTFRNQMHGPLIQKVMIDLQRRNMVALQLCDLEDCVDPFLHFVAERQPPEPFKRKIQDLIQRLFRENTRDGILFQGLEELEEGEPVVLTPPSDPTFLFTSEVVVSRNMKLRPLTMAYQDWLWPSDASGQHNVLIGIFDCRGAIRKINVDGYVKPGTLTPYKQAKETTFTKPLLRIGDQPVGTCLAVAVDYRNRKEIFIRVTRLIVVNQEIKFKEEFDKSGHFQWVKTMENIDRAVERKISNMNKDSQWLKKKDLYFDIWDSPEPIEASSSGEEEILDQAGLALADPLAADISPEPDVHSSLSKSESSLPSDQSPKSVFGDPLGLLLRRYASDEDPKYAQVLYRRSGPDVSERFKQRIEAEIKRCFRLHSVGGILFPDRIDTDGDENVVQYMTPENPVFQFSTEVLIATHVPKKDTDPFPIANLHYHGWLWPTADSVRLHQHNPLIAVFNTLGSIQQMKEQKGYPSADLVESTLKPFEEHWHLNDHSSNVLSWDKVEEALATGESEGFSRKEVMDSLFNFGSDGALLHINNGIGTCLVVAVDYRSSPRIRVLVTRLIIVPEGTKLNREYGDKYMHAAIDLDRTLHGGLSKLGPLNWPQYPKYYFDLWF